MLPPNKIIQRAAKHIYLKQYFDRIKKAKSDEEIYKILGVLWKNAWKNGAMSYPDEENEEEE